MKSIRIRLIASMAVLIAFFVLQAIAVTWFTNAQSVQTAASIRNNTQSNAQLTELATLAQQIRRYEKEYFVYVQNEEKRNGYIKEFDDASGRIRKLLDAVLANSGGAYTKAEISEVNRWRDAHAFYAGEMTRIFNEVKRIQSELAAAPAPAPVHSTAPAAKGATAVAAAAPGPQLPTPAEANDMIKAGKDRFGAELIAGVAKMGKAKTEATLGLAQGSTEGYQQLLSVVMTTVVLGIAIAAFLVFTLPGAITRPISVLSEVADTVARGDLDKPFAVTNVPEFEPLVKSLERMRMALSVLTRRAKAKAAAEVL
jgi:HAMP domain-containing protein